MSILLWSLQIILALFFLVAGGMKTFQYEKARKQLPWVEDVPKGMVTFIGLSELLAAGGLVLPHAFGVMEYLTQLAAGGIGAIMMIAFIFHAYRGEYRQTPFNIVLLLLAMLVVWGNIQNWIS